MRGLTDGYVTEVSYSHGYHTELSLTHLELALLSRGIRWDRTRQPRYLELGFGQGLSLNIHAAACSGEFWGTDFNPAHVQNARELASASGADIRILDQTFVDLGERDDLPEFDVIALAGVWSWVSDASRAAIIDLIKRKLAPGGVLYVSYNCVPGWSAAAGLRDLLILHAELGSPPELPIISKVQDAIAFAQSVADAGALYFKANPGAAERLAGLKSQNQNYLVHEYFARNWRPSPFSEVATQLSGANLEFATTAMLLARIDKLMLSAESRALVASLPNALLQESVRDYLINNQFRKDVFVKGAVAMQPLERIKRLLSLAFTLTKPATDIEMKVSGPIGEVSLNAKLFAPIVAALAENGYAPKSLGELQAHAIGKGRTHEQMLEDLIILHSAGCVRPVQDAAVIKTAEPRCNALNAHLCARARNGAGGATLASPVIGGGVRVGRFEQLFLLARAQQAGGSPRSCAEFAWRCLQSNGENYMKVGNPIANQADALADLTTRAEVFGEAKLPVLAKLGIVAGVDHRG